MLKRITGKFKHQSLNAVIKQETDAKPWTLHALGQNECKLMPILKINVPALALLVKPSNLHKV